MLREVGDRIAVARALHGLGLVALQQGDLELATIRFGEGLAEAGKIGAKLELAQFLEGLAAAACQAGQFRRGCVLLGFSEQLRSTISTPLSTTEQSDNDRCLETIRANLKDEVLATLWTEGQALSMEEAVALALDANSKAIE